MAGNNPFNVFRKNQKFWLVAVTGLAMLSFIIIPAAMEIFRGYGPSGPGDIAKTRRYGKIDHASLNGMKENRKALGKFYHRLFQNLVAPDLSNRSQLQPLESRAAAYSEEEINDESLITHWLLAQYAKERGIKVDSPAISNHLKEITGGLISDKILDQTLLEIGMNERQLEQLLANDLSVDQLHSTFAVSQSVVTPATRWDWFQRLNRELTAEVAAVPVDRFVDQIPNPSEADLKKFFEEHKDKPFNPASPDSGFIQPIKAAFQYIKAVPGQKLLDSITDEEIALFYEANKENLYRKPITPMGQRPNLPGQGSGNIFGTPGAVPGLGGFTPRSSTFPTPPLNRQNATKLDDDAETEDDKSSETANEGSDDMPVENSVPQSDVPVPPSHTEVTTVPADNASPATETNKPTETMPVEPAPTGEDKPASQENAEAAEEKPAETSSRPRDVMIRQVSYQTETEAPAGTEQTTESKPAEEAKSITDSAETKPTADVSPTETSSTETKPVDNIAADDTVPDTSAGQTADVKAVNEENKSDEVDISILYRPLSEVKDEIRQQLALEKAVKSLDVIESKMRDYYKNYYLHFDRGIEPPAMPDLSVLAEEQGLKLEDVEFGNLFDAIRTDFARGEQERNHLLRIYSGASVLFEPNYIEGSTGRILIWVVQQKPEFRPEKLDDVRDEVLNRWKEVQARIPAQQRAEELVAMARSSEKPLADALTSQTDVQVVETEPFTWMTYGYGVLPLYAIMQGRYPQVGEIREKGVGQGDAELDNKQIFAPGEEFMEGVYALQVGETGVVFNQPKNTAYVVRIKSSSPSEEALWERFQTAIPYEYIPAGQPQMQYRARLDWLNKIKDETGFQWLQKPSAQ